MLRKILTWVIGVFFLLYGLVRVVGGVMVVIALSASGEHAALQEGANKVRAAMDNPNQFEIIPLSSMGYMSYIVLMGLVLIFGTAAVLLNRRWGVWVMSSYFALYLLLFLNFMVFNIKVAHLVGSFVLFLLFLWLKPKPVEKS